MPSVMPMLCTSTRSHVLSASPLGRSLSFVVVFQTAGLMTSGGICKCGMTVLVRFGELARKLIVDHFRRRWSWLGAEPPSFSLFSITFRKPHTRQVIYTPHMKYTQRNPTSWTHTCDTSGLRVRMMAITCARSSL